MEKERILQKIRDVMARADVSRTGSVEESATAAKIAAKMMAEYHISQAELRFTSDSADLDAMVERDILDGKTRNAVQWQVQLANAIAEANNCKCIYTSGSYKDKVGAAICILGRDSAVQVCNYLFTYLVNIIQVKCKEEKDRRGIKGPGTKRWGNSFRHGAMQIVRLRLQAAKREAYALRGNTSTTLVAHDKENQKLDTFTEKQYPNLKYVKTKSRFDANGLDSGRKVGEKLVLPTKKQKAIGV